MDSRATGYAQPQAVQLENKLDIDAEILKLKNLKKQYMRCEKLAPYYEELMGNDPPFVPPKMRVIVNKNVPPYEKALHENQALSKCQNEVDLMKERMRNWMQDIDEMKNKIQLAIGSQCGTPTERKKVEEKMA